MQLKIHVITIEDLAPAGYLLRKLDAVHGFSFVYEETACPYHQRSGRPPIDPVMLAKYLLMGFLYGIPAKRQIEQCIRTDVTLRWYLGLDLFDSVADHSTISQLRRKPWFRKIFRRLFEEVVRQCVQSGLVSGWLAVTNSTHVKANVSRASEHEIDVQEEAGNY
ncbi:transposase [Acutalibacter sp. 1XD8-36]|uniref:transposase n=1 Tax=Acutalibacter sp. 1XD8-36 TaxID=2320852 RepID=UPI0024337932|nr:transposase [Acutalibacter sp. 1XD8-36]NBJ90589.1 transposase [Acutalibacter sp. 1XD8-36]